MALVFFGMAVMVQNDTQFRVAVAVPGAEKRRPEAVPGGPIPYGKAGWPALVHELSAWIERLAQQVNGEPKIGMDPEQWLGSSAGETRAGWRPVGWWPIGFDNCRTSTSYSI